MAEDKKLGELRRKRTLESTDKTYIVGGGESYYMTGDDLTEEITKHGVAWGTISGTLNDQTDLKDTIDDLDSDIDTLTSGLATANDRINSIIALPEGSTTGDAELADTHIGVHGQTYSSAGDAIRASAEQLYNMKTGFDGVEYPSPAAMVQGCDELIDTRVDFVKTKLKNYDNSIVAKKTINAWDGTVLQDTALNEIGKTYSMAGSKVAKCKVEYGHRYIVFQLNGSANQYNRLSSQRYGLYDVNGNYISGTSGDVNIEIVNPDAEYLYVYAGTITITDKSFIFMDINSYDLFTQIPQALGLYAYTPYSDDYIIRDLFGTCHIINLVLSTSSIVENFKNDAGKIEIDYNMSSGNYVFSFYEFSDITSIRGKQITMWIYNKSASAISLQLFATNDTWGPSSTFAKIEDITIPVNKNKMVSFTLPSTFDSLTGKIRIGFRDVNQNPNIEVKYTGLIQVTESIGDSNVGSAIFAKFAESAQNADVATYAETAGSVDGLTMQWRNKVWTAYGDSITAISNGDSLTTGWAAYVNDIHGFSAFHGRGVGGQSYSYGAHGGSATFIDETTGNYVNRNDSYNKDNYEGDVPTGCVVTRGCFCSWDRITHMYPASIKDTIDMIYIMGGTNDVNNDTSPTWVDNSTVDPEWAASSYYATYGGDYNITTLKGAVASTIMKMQAWMPQAVIIIGTPLSGRGTTGEIGTTLGDGEYPKSLSIKEVSAMASCPCIDIFGTCGINPWNRVEYITDGVHPYGIAGQKMLGRAVASGLMALRPKID